MLISFLGEAEVIIALTNSKGGVGKSTRAVHLAAWRQEQGAKVALVDADAQGSSAVWLQEASPQTPVLRLQTPDDILDGVPKRQTQFEHLVIDGPGGLTEVTRAIRLVADLAVLPCGPSALDLRAVNEAIRVVKQAQNIRHGPPPAVLVPNKLQVQYRLSRELVEMLATLGIPNSPGLCLRQAYADAAGQGTVVWRLGPRGEMAGNEIRELFHGLLGQKQTDIGRSVANG